VTAAGARTLVFDVDTGVDDALALLFAFGQPDVEIAGIGTVAGNVGVERATENTLKVLKLIGRTEVPVARGCDRPLVQPARPAEAVHGTDGLGESGYPLSGLCPSGEHAIDQLIRVAEARRREVTLVALGPLTNVAAAVVRKPELTQLLRDVVVMGGAFVHPGNMTPLAEFNIHSDPEAARIVFEAGFTLTVVPLDATMQVLLDEDHLASLGDGQVPEFVRRVTAGYLDYVERARGRRASPMHDPLAAAIALDPSLILDGPQYPVSVETEGSWGRGMTVADRRAAHHDDSPAALATVVLRPDAEAFMERFLSTLRSM
jgi:purine nucleosidase